MMPVLAVGDRVQVLIADGGDRRRKDHGVATVVGEFRDYRLLQAKHYRFTVHKRALFCGHAEIRQVGRG